MEVVTTHHNADFDGLASMVAVRKLYPDVRLVLSGGAQEAVHAFLLAHDLSLTKLKDLDLAQVTKLILVDTHDPDRIGPVSYTHLRAHETVLDLVCRLLLEKKKQTKISL